MARSLRRKTTPVIMGILNVTPDSFSDGGRHRSVGEAIDHARLMIEEGADIIDVGGESTRPFSEPVTEKEELHRVIPVIERLRDIPGAFISVDTYKANVAREALLAGADMVNDISGLTYDDAMAGVIAENDAHAVIMHIKGTPRNMQENPRYDDVIGEIKGFLRERVEYAVRNGVDREKIVVDPGIGFGKRVEDNLRILKMLADFKELGRPVLIGTSMKSFIGKLTDMPLEERVEGTLASLAVAIMNGADVLRVHDVRRAKKVLKIVKAVMDA
ncbi:MAG: Dihydropteroate synthase [Syntrophorhabdus sp. PtaB.Bin047]|nr:MAG: Dihydropteroate synthase [Syntrophorhabdus sp. PtaB.Bin047]